MDQCSDPSLRNTFCSPFTTKELTNAISKLSTSTASGPDFIAYLLLTHLPPSAQQHLLSIFNWSWSSHTFPSCWKPATIIPIHKPCKPADSPASYRPISLTSCISKLFELLVLNRFCYYLESRNLISPTQTGFRPGRSTIDQVLFLSQYICDGFQKKRHPDRTVLATIDFSKAFNSVWHSALFHKPLTLIGLPPCFVRWTRSFRQTEGQRSFSVVLEATHFESDAESLRAPSLDQPSSSHMSTTSLNSCSGDKHSLYADDVAIRSSSPDPLKATHSVQKALDHLEECSLKWRLPVNPAKCKCCFFNTDPH